MILRKALSLDALTYHRTLARKMTTSLQRIREEIARFSPHSSDPDTIEDLIDLRQIMAAMSDVLTDHDDQLFQRALRAKQQAAELGADLKVLRTQLQDIRTERRNFERSRPRLNLGEGAGAA